MILFGPFVATRYSPVYAVLYAQRLLSMLECCPVLMDFVARAWRAVTMEFQQRGKVQALIYDLRRIVDFAQYATELPEIQVNIYGTF